MDFIKRLLKYIYSKRIILTLLCFGIVICFLDSRSFLRRAQNKLEKIALQKEIDKYQEMFEEDTKLLNELEENPDVIERIARERYYMKRPNEDVFIFEEKDPWND